MKKYFKNIRVNEDRKYSRSYGGPINTEYVAGYEENGWLFVYSSIGRFECKKSTRAQHFHHYIGKEITERSFNMLLNKLQKQFEAKKEENKKIQEEEDKKLKIEFDTTVLKIKNALNDERLILWQKNEGNAHTRRTRWGNRCERIGIDRGYANTLRDTFFEIIKKDNRFFIDGKFNPDHG